MKPVVQEESMGCGIACVASVVGVSYKKAKQLFSNPADALSGKCYCKDIVGALKRANLNYDYGKVRGKEKSILEKSGTIFFLRRSKKYPVGHYVVKTNGGWIDPWINYPNVNPAKAGIKKKLPGRTQWVIYSRE